MVNKLLTYLLTYYLPQEITAYEGDEQLLLAQVIAAYQEDEPLLFVTNNYCLSRGSIVTIYHW